MKKLILPLLLFTTILAAFSQSERDSLLMHRRYYEDQIYLGVTYDFFVNRPEQYQRTGLPVGFHMGFMKDIPLDKKGQIAFAIGGGYVMNTYKHNISFPGFTMEDLTGINGSNSLKTHAAELQISIRLRNSSPLIKPFWRIYAGVRVDYIAYARNTRRREGEPKSFQDVTPYIDQIQYGPQISFGYGKLNLYATYSLKPLLLGNTPQNNQKNPVDMKEIIIGLRFFIF